MNTPRKFRFVPKKRDLLLNDSTSFSPVVFYQIALFKTKKGYEVKRFYFDNNDRLLDISKAFMSKEKVEKFVDSNKSNIYKIYSVYTLDEVPYPSTSDITLARSDIIQNDYDYSGYAPV